MVVSINTDELLQYDDIRATVHLAQVDTATNKGNTKDVDSS